MRTNLLAAIALAALPATALGNDQVYLDQCIAYWGKSSPFAPGTRANTVLSTGVKVFGVGSGNRGNDPVTKSPRLILVHPSVNVMGKSTIRLSNPKGWYCFRSNVTVAGKIEIEAPCNAQLASAKEDGTLLAGECYLAYEAGAFPGSPVVPGKIEIRAPCDAKIASAKDDGAAVGAADDTGKGVAVFGALRVTRVGCPAK